MPFWSAATLGLGHPQTWTFAPLAPRQQPDQEETALPPVKRSQRSKCCLWSCGLLWSRFGLEQRTQTDKLFWLSRKFQDFQTSLRRSGPPQRCLTVSRTHHRHLHSGAVDALQLYGAWSHRSGRTHRAVEARRWSSLVADTAPLVCSCGFSYSSLQAEIRHL